MNGAAVVGAAEGMEVLARRESPRRAKRSSRSYPDHCILPSGPSHVAVAPPRARAHDVRLAVTAAAPKPFSYPPPKGVVTPAAVLRGALDERQAIATMPASHTLKGMFFTRLVSDLAEDWAGVASELRAPPSLGRYIPFSDYPNADHLLLSFRCARRRFPGLDVPEGLRRLAREHVTTFLESTFGRISAAMIGDVPGALAALPSLYARILSGPRYAYAARAEREVELRLFNGHAPWENVIGQLEGVVLHYGGRPEIECRWEAEATRLFVVRWS